MIRRAEPGDFPRVLALLERLRARIETYPGAELDRESIVKVFGRCASSALARAFVAEHDGKITGLMLGIVQTLWFSNSKEATDLVLYAESPGDGFRMARRFIDWAWSIPKVVCVTLSQSSNFEIDRQDVVLEYMGFRRIGVIRQLENRTTKGPKAA